MKNYLEIAVRITICINLISATVWNGTENVSISIKGLYPTYSNSEIYSSENIITGLSTVSINISDVPSNISFVIVQAHSYLHNLTMSYVKDLDIRYFISGTNLGLTLEMHPSETIYLMNLQDYDVELYFSIHAYYNRAPLPGGCNLEFNIEDAPFMHVSSDKNLIYAEVAQGRKSLDANCDIDSLIVDHQFYQMYFNEWAYSKENYFQYIKNMITVEKILAHGTKVPVNSLYSKLKRSFSLYNCMPTIYAVIADNGQFLSAYVPAQHGGHSSCELSGSDKFYMAMLFIIGFIMTFGYVCVRAWSPFIFIVLAILLTFLLFFNVCDSYKCAFYYCGLLWIVTLLIVTLYLPMLPNLGFSFLAISISLLIYQESYDNTKFSAYFIVMIIVVTSLMTCFGSFGMDISVLVVGSFCLMVLFDFVIGSFLRYITVDCLRRLIVDDFNQAFVHLPFQGRDVGVTLMWIAFAICGFVITRCSGGSGRSIQYPSCSILSMCPTSIIGTALMNRSERAEGTNYGSTWEEERFLRNW